MDEATTRKPSQMDPKNQIFERLKRLDGPITLRIFNGIAWDFTQAKWWMWWRPWSVAAYYQAAAPQPSRISGQSRKKNCIYNIHNLALLKRYCSKSVLLKKWDLLEVKMRCFKPCSTISKSCETTFNSFESASSATPSFELSYI